MASQAAQEESDLSMQIRPLIDTLMTHGLAFDPAEARESVLSALVKAVDPEGALLTDEQWKNLHARQTGSSYDIGIRIGTTNDDVIVTDLLPDSPSAAADLAVGTRLVGINEADIKDWGLHRITQHLRHEQAVPVRVAFLAADGSVSTQMIDRVQRALPGIDQEKELPFSIAYLRLNGLYEGVGATVAERMVKWSEDGFYGIIMDLRAAEGLDLESVRQIASLFAEPGALLAAFRDKDGQDLDLLHAGDSSILGMPVMVLLDERTAGAAEVLAAVLGDSVRGAMLFGRATRGDMMVRSALPTEDGRMIYLATRRLVTADGTAYDGQAGVKPDVVIARADALSKAEESEESPMLRLRPRKETLDEEIEQNKLQSFIRGDATFRRAVDVLMGLKALNIRPQGMGPVTQ